VLYFLVSNEQFLHVSAVKKETLSSDLDTFDLAILRLIQEDNTIPHRIIGEKVNLSAPSVQRRIKRMQKAGVIAAQTAVLEPSKVGLPLTILVEVELKAETGGQIDAIKAEFLAAQEIQQCYYVTGEADFVLVILVGDMAEYEALTQRLFFGNANIRKFKTFVVMDRTKASGSLNI